MCLFYHAERPLTITLDLGWLTGDLIAGVTVGLVVVPQSMSYAIVGILHIPRTSL
jgi:MFS superfamily sulfate permease-like transporter